MSISEPSIGQESSQKPSRGYISKRRYTMRKSIEEQAGKRWEELESQLTERMEHEAQRRHFLIRTSPQMVPVAELLLAGEKPMKIVRFLRKHDPERFGENITDVALLKQIQRFKEEVVFALESEKDSDISTNKLDFYTRLSGKHVDCHAMIIKLVLFQESRLCKALIEENAYREVWNVNMSDCKAKRDMDRAWKKSIKELDRYWKILVSLGYYEHAIQK